MKLGFCFILLFFLTGIAFAEESVSASLPVFAEPGFNIDSVYRNSFDDCVVSQGLVENISGFLGANFNLSKYTYSNYSFSYCYFYDNYENIGVNFIFKVNESDYKGKQVSFSFSTYDVYDFSSIFSELENKILSYELKQKYVEFLMGGPDEEYYVMISSNYELSNTCSVLRDYFNRLSGEKYFEDYTSYCNIILKTRTSDILEIVSEDAGYVYYYTDKISFTFNGRFNNTFDLEKLFNVLDCDISKSNHYYPEFDSDCYGIYKDRTRFYFSANSELENKDWVSLNVYAVVGGKSEFNVYSYSEEPDVEAVQEWVDSIMNEYFNSLFLPVQLVNERDYSYVKGYLLVDEFSFNDSVLNNLVLEEHQMNKYYTGSNVWVTLTEPYIQIRPEQVFYTNKAVIGIIPPHSFWGGSIVITENAVYSSVTLDDNDEVLAAEELNKIVAPFIAPGEWGLSMSVSGAYYMPFIEREVDGVYEEIQASSSIGINDDLALNYPVFESLEHKSLNLWEWIIGLFSFK